MVTREVVLASRYIACAQYSYHSPIEPLDICPPPTHMRMYTNVDYTSMVLYTTRIMVFYLYTVYNVDVIRIYIVR